MIVSLASDARVQVLAPETPKEALPLIREAVETSVPVVVFHIASEAQMAEVGALLRVLRLFLSAGRFRAILTTVGRDPKALARFVDLRLVEHLREPVTEKALSYKINRFVQLSLPRARELAEASGEKEESSPRAQETSGPPKVRYVPPLTLESDCWFMGGARPKRVAGRWAVRLTGPGPLAGRWVEIPDAPVDDFYWQWAPQNPEEDIFVREEGSWVFRGNRPEFRDDLWFFVGQKPDLSFYYEGKSYGSKISTDEGGGLVVATDSDQALRRLPKMKATFEQVVRTKRNAQPVASSASPPAARTAAVSVSNAPDADGDLSPGTLASQVPDPEGHRLAASEFGSGEWEFVGPNLATGGLWYAFVPEDPEGPEGVREQGYWAYSGTRSPRLSGDGRSWIFRDRAPKRYARFADLPKILRHFLEDRLPEEAIAEPEPEAEPVPETETETETETDTATDTDTASDSDLHTVSAREFGAPGGSWEFVSADMNGSRHYVYLSPEIRQRRVGSAKGSGPFWTYDGASRPELSEDGREWVFRGSLPKRHWTYESLTESQRKFLSERGRPASRREEVESLKGELDGIEALEQAVEKAAQKSAIKAAEEIQRRSELEGDDIRVEAKPRAVSPPAHAPAPPTGPVSVKAIRPPGPSLGPVAIAFLMSELLARREGSHEAMARRFCDYLSASCGGLRVELWSRTASGWTCSATSDGAPGELKGLLEQAGREGDDGARLSGDGALVADIVSPDGKLLGALVFGGAGTGLVALDYARVAAEVVSGLAETLAEEAGDSRVAA